MTTRLAINGLGRIGRCILRAYLSNPRKNIKIVSINGSRSLEMMAHLLKHDSTHGTLPQEVKIEDTMLVIGDEKIPCTFERDVTSLNWRRFKVDIVLECTGNFTSKEQSVQHINVAGAKKVLVSAPAKNADKTIVCGVNHKELRNDHTVVSIASCTTNCLAPMAKVLNDAVGIKTGLMTTIHSYTNDQRLLDGSHRDYRRSRSATMSMIPTSTGAATAIGAVIPELEGKMTGIAVRVPTPNVSLVDLTCLVQKETSVDEINEAFKEAANSSMEGYLAYNTIPLVSIDFNQNPASSIFDATQTKVMNNNLVKTLAWYDNEWGFSNRMLDLAERMGKDIDA